jgi:hypothetical protein
MDFAETKASAAREIALAFGVPPLLIGLPGDNTFRNYEEANRAFWRQTIIPLVRRMQKAFHAWAQPGFSPFRLDYDADRIDALAKERALEWSRIGSAAFLTVDEQREAAGYGPMGSRTIRTWSTLLRVVSKPPKAWTANRVSIQPSCTPLRGGSLARDPIGSSRADALAPNDVTPAPGPRGSGRIARR